MTIAATGDGFFHCMCDDCNDLFEDSGNSFWQMIQMISRSAWIAYWNEDVGVWQHRCGGCIQEQTQTKLEIAIAKFS